MGNKGQQLPIAAQVNKSVCGSDYSRGDPVIAFSDFTDRTSFKKLSCVVATCLGEVLHEYNYMFHDSITVSYLLVI
jgi:hypothetical protein